VICVAITQLARSNVPNHRHRALKGLLAAFRTLHALKRSSLLWDACREGICVVLRAMARARDRDDWIRGSIVRALTFCDPDEDFALVSRAIDNLARTRHIFTACDMFRVLLHAKRQSPRHSANVLAPRLRARLLQDMARVGASFDAASYSQLKAEELKLPVAPSPTDFGEHRGQGAAVAVTEPMRMGVGRVQPLVGFTSQATGILEVFGHVPLESGDTAMLNALVEDALRIVADADPRSIGRLLRAVAPLDIRIRGTLPFLQRHFVRGMAGVTDDAEKVLVFSSAVVALARSNRLIADSLHAALLDAANAVMADDNESKRRATYEVLSSRLSTIAKTSVSNLSVFFRYRARSGATADPEELRLMKQRSEAPLAVQRLLQRILLRFLAGEYRRTRATGIVASADTLRPLLMGLRFQRGLLLEERRKFITGCTKLLSLYARLSDDKQRSAGLQAIRDVVLRVQLSRAVRVAAARELEENMLDQLRVEGAVIAEDVRCAWLALSPYSSQSLETGGSLSERPRLTPAQRRQLDKLAAAPLGSSALLKNRACLIYSDATAIDSVVSEALATKSPMAISRTMRALEPSA
jgi:hypothetical protein